MKVCLKVFCVLGILWWSGVQFVHAQILYPQAQPSSQSSPAKPVSRSSGQPSNLEIKQNILAQKNAAVQAQLAQVKRCIADASLPQILRDPEGNLNRVPQTDLVDCTRRLATLQRKLESLARESAQLAEEAKFQGVELQQLLQTKSTAARIQGKSGQ